MTCINTIRYPYEIYHTKQSFSSGPRENSRAPAKSYISGAYDFIILLRLCSKRVENGYKRGP